MNSFGKTIFAKKTPSGRHRCASFIFKDDSSAAAVLNAEGLEFDGRKLTVIPWSREESLVSVNQLASTVKNRYQRSRKRRDLNKAHLVDSEQLSDEDVKPTQKLSRRQLFCFTCKKPFGSKELLSQHFATDEHKHVVQFQQRSDLVDGVKLKGLEPGYDIPELKALMNSFGKIVHTNCTPRGRMAIFVFQDTCSAAAVLNAGRLEFGGRKLMAYPWKTKKSQPSADDLFVKQARSAVDKLCVDRPIEEQLAELELQIADNESTRISRLSTILSHIDAALSRLYPGMVMHPFGSSVTNLAFFNSDVDLFIELPFVDKNVVHRVTDKLRFVGDPFAEVVPVLGAKTPIVKFHHISTGLSCDISFKNCLGERNSRLLRYYIGLDPRVRQLMMTIKLWARLHGIANGRGGVTSYTLVLLVLFHLQHLGIVPPVCDLQRSSKLETVDGWVCGFHPTSKKIYFNMSLPSLLQSFFSFYSKFKWHQFVVCPLLGKEIHREDLLDPDKFPPEMAPLKAMLCGNHTSGFQSESAKVICVQDPFALDHNLTRGLVPSMARKLINLVVVSAHAVAEADSSQVLSRLLATQIAKDAQAMSENLCKLRIAQFYEDTDKWEACVWCQLVKVLKSVFKLRVTPITHGRKTVELECHGYHDTLAGRAEVEKRLQDEGQDAFKNLSPISQQVAVSDELLGVAIIEEKPKARSENVFLKNEVDISEDMDNLQIDGKFDDDSESDDSLEDDVKDLEDDNARGIDGLKCNIESNFKFLRDVDFEWDVGLVDPIDCVPMIHLTARVIKRRGYMQISLSNNGTFGTFMPQLGRFCKNNLVHWIKEELKELN